MESCDDTGIECVFTDGQTRMFVLSKDGTSPVGSSMFATDERKMRELSHNLVKKQRHRLFLGNLARFRFAFKPTRKMIQLTLEDGSHCTDETVSIRSIDSLDNDGDELLSLIEQRLWKTGIIQSSDEIEFVPDSVSKEVEGVLEEVRSEQLQDETKSHVKTGVWEVQCFNNDDGSPKEPFYIVTGVDMDDRVDLKKLRKAIFREPQRRRPRIRLAATEIAESLTGFQSGTMMPICHSVDMILYFEESIAQKRHDANHRIICGSGMFGKCLSLSIDTFMRIAEANPKGLSVDSIIQKKRTKEP